MRRMAVRLRGKCLFKFILKTKNKQEHFNVTLTSGMISYLICMRDSSQNLIQGLFGDSLSCLGCFYEEREPVWLSVSHLVESFGDLTMILAKVEVMSF